MKGTKFVGALALLVVATAIQAQVYTWKDASGRVHFSDQPPPEANARPIKGKASTPSTPEPSSAASEPGSKKNTPKTWQEKEQESRQKKAEQAQTDEKKKQEQAKQAEKERYCNDLRKNLALLERGGRIGRPNDKGEMEYFSDDQITREAEQTRSRIARDCK